MYIALIGDPMIGKVVAPGQEEAKEFYFLPTDIYHYTLEDALNERARSASPNEGSSFCGLEKSRALRLFSQICYALTNCHKKGIIHKDLKPGNIGIVVDEDGVEESVRLTDFGCGSLYSVDRSSGGDYSYPSDLLAPEYAGRELKAEHIMDGDKCKLTNELNTWSAGAMLYRMITGKYLVERPKHKLGTPEREAEMQRIYAEIKDQEGIKKKIKPFRLEMSLVGLFLDWTLVYNPETRRGALEKCLEHLKANGYDPAA
jgi:serine/threonine protein kinase